MVSCDSCGASWVVRADLFAPVGRRGRPGKLSLVRAARLALVLIALTPGPVVARQEMSLERRTEVLSEALAAFDRGTELAHRRPEEAVAAYREAEEMFASLVADGVENGKLYYNLGNANLQLGRIGRAILNYRRAEELIGSDPQLQANLRYARSLCRNQIQRSGEKELLRTLFFWHYDTSCYHRYIVAAGAYVAFWLLLIARTFVRQGGLAYAAVVLLVVWLSAGVSVAVEIRERGSVREGVAVQNDIVVRKGNGEGYDPQFKESLYEGVEFIVIEQRPGWYKIELSDGNSGWIRENQADIV